MRSKQVRNYRKSFLCLRYRTRDIAASDTVSHMRRESGGNKQHRPVVHDCGHRTVCFSKGPCAKGTGIKGREGSALYAAGSVAGHKLGDICHAHTIEISNDGMLQAAGSHSEF